MAADDRVQRAAGEFEATAKRHGLAQREEFTDFLRALEIGVSRIYGEGLYQLMRRSDVLMIREMHTKICPKFAPPEHLREMGHYYDVTDLDGEVHAFSDPHKAAAALRVVLSDASRRDAEALDEAWELNEGLIGKFDETLRSEIAGEYTELRDRVIETAKRAAQAARRQETPERAEAADPAQEGAAIADPRRARVEQLRRDRGIPDETPSGDTLLLEAGYTQTEIERSRARAAPIKTEQPSQAGLALPVSAERPEQGGGASPPQSPPARNDAEERKSALIPVPLKGSRGEADYRTWSVALFLPRVRRQTSEVELAWLLGDNAKQIEACRKGGISGDDLREFKKTIDEAWVRCK